jgi:acetolactate synthase small subunit
MVAFCFLREIMRWCFWTQMEDLGRMEARVMQVIDRLQATIISLSSVRLDGHIFLSGVMEADETQADRIERLMRRTHGMESVKAVPETAAVQSAIALFRILCDLTERAEVLQFVSALNARVIMVRPLWVAFQVVGSPQEIEGVYQSALAYGIVDIVSSSCAIMTAISDTDRDTNVAFMEEAAGCARLERKETRRGQYREAAD